MERGTFELVDALLSEGAGRDARAAALGLIRAAEKVNMLDLAVHTVANRFALQEQAVKDWYLEKCKREVLTNG